jgi:hypothetical protein
MEADLGPRIVAGAVKRRKEHRHGEHLDGRNGAGGVRPAAVNRLQLNRSRINPGDWAKVKPGWLA